MIKNYILKMNEKTHDNSNYEENDKDTETQEQQIEES
jgi:hypothetical protein